MGPIEGTQRFKWASLFCRFLNFLFLNIDILGISLGELCLGV